MHRLCHSLSQIQRRTSEIANALFIRGRNSSIDTNKMNYDVASGVADLLKVMYGEANNGAYMECVSKYVAIIAGQFQPFMKPPEYLDGSDYESRLSSLLGRCIEAHELDQLAVYHNGFRWNIPNWETLRTGTRI